MRSGLNRKEIVPRFAMRPRESLGRDPRLGLWRSTYRSTSCCRMRVFLRGRSWLIRIPLCSITEAVNAIQAFELGIVISCRHTSGVRVRGCWI